MIRDGMNFFKAWPSIAPGIAFAFLAAGPSAAETVREMESARGRVRIAILPVETWAAPASGVFLPSAPADQAAPEAPEAPEAREAGKDSIHPVEAITDFTSLSGMAREGEAMLQVTYFDKATGEELKFPLKYSELRRYLRNHPLAYRGGSLADRNVDLMGDLAGALRIKMVPPGDRAEKP